MGLRDKTRETDIGLLVFTFFWLFDLLCVEGLGDLGHSHCQEGRRDGESGDEITEEILNMPYLRGSVLDKIKK